MSEPTDDLAHLIESLMAEPVDHSIPSHLHLDDSVHGWVARARARALATGEGAEEIAPGVMRAEAEAAAAHAIVVQKGYSTPEIEAERLSHDRRGA